MGQPQSIMGNEEVAAVFSHLSPISADVDECLHRELHACSSGEQCLNLEGSYRCVPTQLPNHTDEGNTESSDGRRVTKAMSRVDGLQTSVIPVNLLGGCEVQAPKPEAEEGLRSLGG